MCEFWAWSDVQSKMSHLQEQAQEKDAEVHRQQREVHRQQRELQALRVRNYDLSPV